MKENGNQPDARDFELWGIEDDFLRSRIEGLGSLVDAQFQILKFIADNPDKELCTGISPPGRSKAFKADLLPILPKALFKIANFYYEQLVDAGQKQWADQQIERVKKKWQGKP